ncbi:MAG: ATP-binding protein [Phycisphaerae bacterium]|nr:ATP-binding protein [Phycisphaerae bacterium]
MSAHASTTHATGGSGTDTDGRALAGELDRLRGYFDPSAAPTAALTQRGQAIGDSALARIARMFDLTPFERDVLVLCAGIELDSEFGSALARVGGSTFGVALAALPGSHWSAATPNGPLRAWRLVELAGGGSLTASSLRIDEAVLHALLGLPHHDERLAGVLRMTTASSGPLNAPEERAASALREVWRTSRDGVVVQLCGLDRASLIAVISAATDDRAVALIAATELPTSATERAVIARLIERHAKLSDAVLVFDCHDVDAADAERAVAIASRCSALCVFLARDTLIVADRPSVRIDVDRATATEIEASWRRALTSVTDSSGERVAQAVRSVSRQFALSRNGFRSAVAALRVTGLPVGGDALEAALWDACRCQARVRIEALAPRVRSYARWKDLILPVAQREAIDELVIQARHRALAESWGMTARRGAGLGVSALFAGPSGTGKSLAAEVVANELRLDLHRVDLSAVVNKYIGETEKNLRRVFDAAEEGTAVLVFDEADALFGKRSEVRDSHDRYANLEVSYLLQRMESYRGVAILTTNHREALDPSFLRRLRFVVEFPFPEAAQRAEIWRRTLEGAPRCDELDWTRLSALSVAGGNIANIAIAAAFLAQEDAAPIGMRHLARAARRECAKIERPISDREIGGWI